MNTLPTGRKIAVQDLIQLARDAGALIMGHYGRQDGVQTKQDGTPLTLADKASHEHICAGLAALDKTIPVVSEEGEIPAFETRKSWARFWLVDPLDGTKEFLKRNGEFTVNIALIEGGVPVLGVVYAPALDLLYYADAADGAWKQHASERPIRLLSAPVKPGSPVVVAESRSHPSAELEAYLAKLNVKSRVQVGSSLKFGYVAEGKADLYPRLGPTMEWDCAAGDCVYRYSGRAGVRDSGLRYNSPTLRFERFIIGEA